MLPLLGLLGPVGWGVGGAIIAGTAAYKYFNEEQKKNTHLEKINNYKISEQTRFKVKYDLDIEYRTIKKDSIIEEKIIIKNQSYQLAKDIVVHKNKIDELTILLKQLEVNKYGSTK